MRPDMEIIQLLIFWICLMGVITPFLILPAMLTLGDIFKADNKHLPDLTVSGELPSVTLLVCAFNEETIIEEKIKNSLAINYPKNLFEIVIASDGSTDETTDIVKKYEQLDTRIRLFDWHVREGKVNVINKSLPKCSGEIIILSDANAMCNSECAKIFVKHFFDKRVGAVAGEKRVIANEASTNTDLIGHTEGLYWRLESYIKKMESRWGNVIGADGAIYAIRKSAFEPVPAKTSVDDFLNTMKILKNGWRVEYNDKAYVTEYATQSLTTEFNRKVRIAAGQFYNLIVLKEMLNIRQYGWISIFYIMHKLSRLFSPFLFMYITFFCFLNTNSGFILVIISGLLLSYLAAGLGFYLEEKKQIKQKVLHLITYYYLTVVAQLVGLIRQISGMQTAVWDKLILQQNSGVGVKPLFYYSNIPTHNLRVIYNHS